MSKIEKLIAKIENYKSGNKIEFSDLEKYLKYSGFKKKKTKWNKSCNIYT